MYRNETSYSQLRLLLDLVVNKKPSKGIVEQRCQDLISKIKQEVKEEIKRELINTK